jgi:hypothetical protein
MMPRSGSASIDGTGVHHDTGSTGPNEDNDLDDIKIE